MARPTAARTAQTPQIESPETMQEHLQTSEVPVLLQGDIANIYQALDALTQEVRALRREVLQKQPPAIN